MKDSRITQAGLLIGDAIKLLGEVGNELEGEAASPIRNVTVDLLQVNAKVWGLAT